MRFRVPREKGGVADAELEHRHIVETAAYENHEEMRDEEEKNPPGAGICLRGRKETDDEEENPHEENRASDDAEVRVGFQEKIVRIESIFRVEAERAESP